MIFVITSYHKGNEGFFLALACLSLNVKKPLSHLAASLVCANFPQAMELPRPKAREVFLLLVGGRQVGPGQDFLGSETTFRNLTTFGFA